MAGVEVFRSAKAPFAARHGNFLAGVPRLEEGIGHGARFRQNDDGTERRAAHAGPARRRRSAPLLRGAPGDLARDPQRGQRRDGRDARGGAGTASAELPTGPGADRSETTGRRRAPRARCSAPRPPPAWRSSSCRRPTRTGSSPPSCRWGHLPARGTARATCSSTPSNGAGRATSAPRKPARIRDRTDAPRSTSRDAVELMKSLTPQQARILQLVCEGKFNKQIAYHLDISEGTVKAHLSAILRKLNVQNRTQAVLIAQSAGLVDLARLPRRSPVGSSRASPTRRSGRRNRAGVGGPSGDRQHRVARPACSIRWSKSASMCASSVTSLQNLRAERELAAPGAGGTSATSAKSSAVPPAARATRTNSSSPRLSRSALNEARCRSSEPPPLTAGPKP